MTLRDNQNEIRDPRVPDVTQPSPVGALFESCTSAP